MHAERERGEQILTSIFGIFKVSAFASSDWFPKLGLAEAAP